MQAARAETAKLTKQAYGVALLDLVKAFEKIPHQHIYAAAKKHTPYSDASREKGAVHESGYGAWVIMVGIFFYVEGRWSEAEVERLDINALELAAMNIGSFTFLEEARRRGVSISHLCEFTDNTSAEYAADRGTLRG